MYIVLEKALQILDEIQKLKDNENDLQKDVIVDGEWCYIKTQMKAINFVVP